MTRRRYLSTDISVDPKVADLATEYGDFAALLYTWLIPHAGDDASVPRDARKIVMAVVPGLGKTAKDVEHAVNGMVKLGLLEYSRDGGLRFPESFFRHQSYITEKRRGSAQPEPTPPTDAPTPDAERTTAQNGALPRTTAKNRASSSFKSSSSFSSSVPVTSIPPAPSERPPTPIRGESVPKPIKPPNPVTTFLDAVRALDGDLDVFGDKSILHKRLLANPEANVPLLAEAFVSFMHGEWPGSRILIDTQDPQWLIGDIGAYVVWKGRQSKHPGAPPNAEPEMVACPKCNGLVTSGGYGHEQRTSTRPGRIFDACEWHGLSPSEWPKSVAA